MIDKINNLKDLINCELEVQKIERPNFPYLFKSKFTDKKANDLERTLLAYFKCIGGMAERVKNQGREVKKITKHNCSVFGEVLQEERTFIPSTGRNGTSDVKALYKGLTFAIEVKIGKDRMSEAQKKYKEDIEKFGGYYIVAKDFESFVDEFKKIVILAQKI